MSDILLGALETVLGPSSGGKDGSEHSFHCPFCNHHKPKLGVRVDTDSKGKNLWNCWVCNTKGGTIKSLLYKMGIDKAKISSILRYVKNGDDIEEGDIAIAVLPQEFISLDKPSYLRNEVLEFLYSRGLSYEDIQKHEIGYCAKGKYRNRVIIPSYSEAGVLNYFIARAFDDNSYKYLNPPVSKNTIMFESHINWSLPIILVEGAFDAIAVKRNAIPILGKNISEQLMMKLVLSQVQEVYVALDNDAKREAVLHSENLLNMGKKVFLVDLKDKDPSDMGFKAFTKLVQSAKELTFADMMKYKIMSSI